MTLPQMAAAQPGEQWVVSWVASAQGPHPVGFAGSNNVTVAPGISVWSDPVELPFVPGSSAVELTGRKLAVSFHVAGESGPMTWHAKGLQTSYVSPPGSGPKGASEDEAA